MEKKETVDGDKIRNLSQALKNYKKLYQNTDQLKQEESKETFYQAYNQLKKSLREKVVPDE